VKSSTLAIDILGNSKDHLGGVQDSRIRNKVFNLRKDLDLYYLSEGKNDDIKIQIPKGKYKIEFSKLKNKTLKQSKKNKLKRLTTLYYISAVLLAMVVFLSILLVRTHSSSHTKIDKSTFVSSFLDTDQTLNIALGSRELYLEIDHTLNTRKYILDTDLSLPTDKEKFDSISSVQTGKKITNPKFYRHIDIEHMHISTQINLEWGLAGTECNILESIMVDDLNTLQHNTLFISKTASGNFHKFSALFDCSKFVFDDNNRFAIKKFCRDDECSRTVNFKSREMYLIIKRKLLPNGRYVLFLLCNNRFGWQVVFKHLHSKAFNDFILDSFQDSNKLPTEFELLLKIKDEDLQFKSETIDHKIIYNSDNP